MLVIKTKNLTKKFKGISAVNSINLEVPEKSIYGFLGQNGAGKTTTIRMLLGLIHPTQGNVQIFGKEMRKAKYEILRNVGALVEMPSLYPNLTGRENLEVTAKILRIEQKRIDEVLETVDLNNAKNKKVSDYSLGMKQRLGLALALLSHPKVLILDEPTNGLDPQGIREIRSLIKTFPEKEGITVFLSSHLLSEIELIASHIGIIHRGNLLFQGTLADLENNKSTNAYLKTDNSSKLLALLSKTHHVSLEQNGLIKIKAGTPQELAAINTEIIKNGIPLYESYFAKENLEDIFVNITKASESGTSIEMELNNHL